jgi:hypothetical protein
MGDRTIKWPQNQRAVDGLDAPHEEIHVSMKARRNNFAVLRFRPRGGDGACADPEEEPMNGIIYIVGLIVIIMFILSFLGLR